VSRSSIRALEVEGVGEVHELAGCFDGYDIQEHQAVYARLLQEGNTVPVFDCARLTVLNDTDLGSLQKYADAFRARGGGITLVGVPKKIRIVLEMLDLVRLFLAVRDEPVVAPGPARRLAFRLRAPWRHGAAVLSAEGLLDDATLPGELEPLRQGPKDLVLECGGLRVAGARGLELLARASTGLAHAGGSLALLGVSAELRGALERSGLERVFTVVCEDQPVT
jgi:anti-anti-sigma regulatory factor